MHPKKMTELNIETVTKNPIKPFIGYAVGIEISLYAAVSLSHKAFHRTIFAICSGVGYLVTVTGSTGCLLEF